MIYYTAIVYGVILPSRYFWGHPIVKRWSTTGITVSLDNKVNADTRERRTEPSQETACIRLKKAFRCQESWLGFMLADSAGITQREWSLATRPKQLLSCTAIADLGRWATENDPELGYLVNLAWEAFSGEMTASGVSLDPPKVILVTDILEEQYALYIQHN